MKIEDCFKIGYISKTHGLKGEVTAVFESELALDDVQSLFLEFNGGLVPYFIEKISGKDNKPFLKFETVDDQAMAANLKGCHIYLPKSFRPKLKRGQFYDDEVIGFSVEDETAGALGDVIEVQGSGVNRLLTIERNGKEILVPVNSPFIKSINKTEKRIKLNLPGGYLEF
ncbi:MAG TPA: ribosome maturation factor RimM [Cyclobacteriaceae bacterium]|jgi:16S rRNA processing protein RimM|nr:ribosome maturation factor RimM [Cyclobacteriaceae bacterium]